MKSLVDIIFYNKSTDQVIYTVHCIKDHKEHFNLS